MAGLCASEHHQGQPGHRSPKQAKRKNVLTGYGVSRENVCSRLRQNLPLRSLPTEHAGGGPGLVPRLEVSTTLRKINPGLENRGE